MVRRVLLAVAVWLAFLPAGLRAAPPPSEIEAVSKPSADVTLSFVRGGRVATVPVREGDTVKAGQLLAGQDDEAEQIQLAQLVALAADKTRIRIPKRDVLF